MPTGTRNNRKNRQRLKNKIRLRLQICQTYRKIRLPGIKMTTKPSNNLTFDMPVQFLKGVGPARADAFAKLDVKTAADLLEYYPREWYFAPPPVKIEQLKPDHTVTLAGIVESTDWQAWRKPPYFEAYINDETGLCRIVWFHGRFLQDKITPGMKLVVWGKTTLYKHQLQLTNPKFVIVDADEIIADSFSGPVYPATAELSSGQIKKIIHDSLDNLVELVPEFFDSAFMKKANLIGRQKALKQMHNPHNETQIADAKRRLKYDELFLMQAALALRRYKVRNFEKAVALKCTEQIDRRIRKRFPFLLTEDQDKVIEEISADLSKTVPMNRLLQGDVGSGKTVVALHAALLAIANKQQVAIMAPTEILATQHFTSIERYLRNSDVKRVLITGGITGEKRKEILDDIKSGNTNIAVGTVALLQEDIQFADLALVIIDEQHKFGVHQRAGLRKDTTPHCLVMTATPIPRTLAMTVFGDLDISIIKHSPPGRGQVVTRYIQPKDLPKAYEFIRERLKAKQQVFFVYPRIVDSENGDVKAAIAEYENLSKKIFPEFSVGLLHGQMSGANKQKIMDDFRRGKIHCLVSTVLIEVGIDVPNATIMVIEEADRFGLAQLHQLRGRIARSSSKSYCLLIAQTENETAKSRLEIMERSSDGFEIAEHDLKLRGPGELLSARQHGLPDLKIANIIDDSDLLQMARKDAFELVEKDPMLSSSGHKNIRTELIRKFSGSLTLVDVA
ncbi:MAG: ATP-dependent DNA helicase RecG [Planctomycetes bacterium]|nr:ATP-dependent DNA helicase RecG [Planctomycetota bacterium]MBU1517352.1 ATP-dependent DNA helicase RecG [Planctomycetota bacterium]MBU2457689.1 ATP-dependent DNA helicase RecG [Planctomycetota bacterium]MBU2597195.1 ATP-dependent DNA helicase RecG [Planctomycetota bacterium]